MKAETHPGCIFTLFVFYSLKVFQPFTYKIKMLAQNELFYRDGSQFDSNLHIKKLFFCIIYQTLCTGNIFTTNVKACFSLLSTQLPFFLYSLHSFYSNLKPRKQQYLPLIFIFCANTLLHGQILSIK